MTSEDPFGERAAGNARQLYQPGHSTPADSLGSLDSLEGATTRHLEDPFGERMQRKLATHEEHVAEAVVNHATVRTYVRYLGNNAPMVLILPDFPGQERNEDLARSLAQEGLSTAIVGYRGTYHSEGNFSFSGAVYDIEQVVEGLREQFPSDQHRTVILGEGYGALFGMNYIKDHQEIRNSVLLSPLFDLAEFMKEVNLDDYLERNKGKARGEPLQWSYEQGELLQFSNPAAKFSYLEPTLRMTRSSASHIQEPELEAATMAEGLELCNLLVIYGTQDHLILPHHAQALYQQSPCRKKIIPVEGAEHFFPEHREQMIRTVTQHLTETLQRK